jgi:hypothetical protein
MDRRTRDSYDRLRSGTIARASWGHIMRATRITVVALAASFAAIPSNALEGWERLGSRTVEFRNDSDTITVGRLEGRFSAVMFEVQGGAIELDNLTILFGSGLRYSPPTKPIFGEDGRSRAIDLPGAARIIRSVTFDYRSLAAGEVRATVTLYGR